MTDPDRWSDVSSDADPVLRAVMRYARQIEPSPQDVASLAAAVARAEARVSASRTVGSAPFSRLGSWVTRSRRSLYWAGSLALLGAAGAALAMNLELSPSQRGIATVTPEIIRDERAPAVPTPAARGELPTPTPALSARPARPARGPAALSAVSPSASGGATEVSLLTTARHALDTDPQRTLLLLTTHEGRYPSSSFAEERAALRIEALYRLGRSAEAERDFTRFTERFPASIYIPRLIAARPRE